MIRRALIACLLCGSLDAARLPAQELGREGFADSGGVKIHYHTLGDGPLIVMLHGFPDYWYTWRDQMPVLAKHYQVVAIDLRGYNKSGQPVGVEEYAVGKLVGDVAAVLKHFQRDKAIIVGHDWGGFIAWSFAMAHPEQTERLIVLNLPHPKGMLRELANNPDQRRNSGYARALQQPESHRLLAPATLALWVKEADARKYYVEAFQRSSIEGMVNYYRANYPREPYKDDRQFPKVKCPVLMIHGLQDQYLLPGALNDTWKWLDKDLTLVTVPKAGHFVHRDATETVNRTMLRWLRE